MGKIHTTKNGKLHIYVRKDKYKGKLKSNNWVGRTYIQGKDKIKSSGKSDFKQAKKVLEHWYDNLQFSVSHNIQIHDNSFKDCASEFLKYISTTTKIRSQTKKWYVDRFNILFLCKDLMSLKVGTLTAMDIEKTFIVWRMDRAKKQSKVLRGQTLRGDLMAISGFLKWCYENKLRKTKLENIALILNKKLRHQRTTRTLFTKDEYNQLLKVSRKRIKEGTTLRIRFNRERLHQFMIFMVGTGLRVDECLNLEWSDVEFMDRQKERKNVLSEIQLDENSRYWLRINVPEGKTNERQCKSVSSAYFALQRLMKLYKETGLGKVKGQIFEVNSFRDGLNSLLDEANLKTKKIGDAIVRRDSKSFRNTFIQFMLDKGVSAHAVAKNCGTSTAMIDKFYTANSAIESMLDVWLQTGRIKLKAVS